MLPSGWEDGAAAPDGGRHDLEGLGSTMSSGGLCATGEAVDVLDLALDRLRQGEGIEGLAELLETLDLGMLRCAGQEAIEGRLGLIAHALEPAPDTYFAHELDGGLEEIHRQPPLVSIQIVERGTGFGGVMAVPARG